MDYSIEENILLSISNIGGNPFPINTATENINNTANINTPATLTPDNSDIDSNTNNNDSDNNSDNDSYSDNDESDNMNIKYNVLTYNLDEDIEDEHIANQYHLLKDTGNWKYAKLIIASNNNDKQSSEFLWDHLESQFIANNDDFIYINRVYYKSYLDLEIVYDFERNVGKYLIENLKIPAYKPNGYIFSNDENANKWGFKVVVITDKGIYSMNRYINENTIGFYP